MSACDTIREQAQAYLDAALAPRERDAFDAHLAACEACRRSVAGYRALFAALDEPAVPAPPANFTAGVLRRVGAARRRRAAWQAAAAAAVLVAAAAALTFAWNDALAGAVAGLGNFGAREALSGGWPELAQTGLDLLDSAVQGLDVLPSGAPWAALVLGLLVADVLVAYHWRFLARLNGRHKAGVIR